MSSSTESKWLLVIAAGLAIFMAQLDSTIVNVALPSIDRQLGASPAVGQWVVLGYVLPLIALSLFWGRWIDENDSRPALIVGVGGFLLSSAGCALAGCMVVLVGLRVVQGAFASLMLALAPTMAVRAVANEARGTALGVVSSLAPLGAVVGPVAGGQLVQAAGWRAIFLANFPLATTLLLVGRWQLPAAKRRPTAPAAAWSAEAALFALAGGAALVGVSLGGNLPPWFSLCAAAPVFVWIWGRTKTSDRVIDLVRSPGMAPLHAALLFAYTCVLLVQYLTPFFLRQKAGESPSQTGWVLLAFPAASAVAGLASGALSDRFGPRPIAAVGAAVMTAAGGLLIPLSARWTGADVAWRLTALGTGFGLVVTAVQALAMQMVPRRLLGTTSASTNLARQSGLALGPALGTASWALSGYALAGMRAAMVVAAAAAALTCMSVLVRLRAIRPSPNRFALHHNKHRSPIGGKHQCH